ncbi:hypothetical protein O3P69_009680 [Scylla paramamosain]|uniref:Uncharacterized protein n=1 Tax=Scylla paramamosain TaxID=85552 RepID=A0AAW0SDS3_SCYPA
MGSLKEWGQRAGEHLLSPEKNISGGDVTLDSVSPLNSPSFTLNETVPDFNLDFNLDEALKFVGLNCSETGETVWKPSEPEPTSDNKESPGKEEEDSLDTLNDTLDDMIQASQLHPQHLRSLQGTARAASHSTNQNILQEKSFLRTQLIIYAVGRVSKPNSIASCDVLDWQFLDSGGVCNRKTTNVVVGCDIHTYEHVFTCQSLTVGAVKDLPFKTFSSPSLWEL